MDYVNHLARTELGSAPTVRSGLWFTVSIIRYDVRSSSTIHPEFFESETRNICRFFEKVSRIPYSETSPGRLLLPHQYLFDGLEFSMGRCVGPRRRSAAEGQIRLQCTQQCYAPFRTNPFIFRSSATISLSPCRSEIVGCAVIPTSSGR